MTPAEDSDWKGVGGPGAHSAISYAWQIDNSLEISEIWQRDNSLPNFERAYNLDAMKQLRKPRLGRRVCGVYMISTTTGGIYIGASVNVGQRWSQHCANLKAGRCERPELQRDYDAGCDLMFRVLVECEPEQLLTEERAWIETRDPRRVFNKHWSDDARSRRPRKHRPTPLTRRPVK